MRWSGHTDGNAVSDSLLVESWRWWGRSGTRGGLFAWRMDCENSTDQVGQDNECKFHAGTDLKSKAGSADTICWILVSPLVLEVGSKSKLYDCFRMTVVKQFEDWVTDRYICGDKTMSLQSRKFLLYESTRTNMQEVPYPSTPFPVRSSHSASVSSPNYSA